MLWWLTLQLLLLLLHVAVAVVVVNDRWYDAGDATWIPSLWRLSIFRSSGLYLQFSLSPRFFVTLGSSPKFKDCLIFINPLKLYFFRVHFSGSIFFRKPWPWTKFIILFYRIATWQECTPFSKLTEIREMRVGGGVGVWRDVIIREKICHALTINSSGYVARQEKKAKRIESPLLWVS